MHLLTSVSFWRNTAVAVLALFLFNALFAIRITPRFWGVALPDYQAQEADLTAGADYASYVLPAGGVALPIQWNDLGKQMVDAGVIDRAAFESIYLNRGGLSPEERAWLVEEGNAGLVFSQESAPVLLNLLWAFGLANKNPILNEGSMQNPEYGGAGGFASTGGWTLAVGDSMDHYSMHAFVTLTDDQQSLVERVSKGIYRPCCGNSVYFPDCNHGMAMLGLLELLASQGVSEQDMYRYALAVNSYWFPETYFTIAKFIDMKGLSWGDVTPQEILGYNFSSSAGYQNILAQVEPVRSQGGGGCGV